MMNRLSLRLLVIEALDEISAELEREGDDCVAEDEMEEQSVSGAVGGYILPLGKSNFSRSNKSILNIAHRSFGGSGKKNKNR
jgi:hypothetical protein